MYYTPALLTDLYQLTMAYGYWKTDKAETKASFNLFFRKHPFGGKYTIAAGLGLVFDYIENFKFTNEDIEYLESLGGDDKLFDRRFLNYLKNLKLDVDICAVDEGQFVFPNEPILRVSGKLAQCQLLETALLNIINFNTLIATKAARICRAAGDKPVIEFGLRRAQGPDGGLSASRSAYIGGCVGTSDVLAGKMFGIPVKGTHAHSWVMSFDSQQDAFNVYAEHMPNSCILLVDTYDLRSGVADAINTAEMMRVDYNKELYGIRIDSGDLAYGSRYARNELDKHGFNNVKIIVSNDLDEYSIKTLNEVNAPIDAYGVGTKLATAKDDPALGGVYKLSAVSAGLNNRWRGKLKYSGDKTTLPGVYIASRVFDLEGSALNDIIHYPGYYTPPPPACYKFLTRNVIFNGERMCHKESLTKIRDRVKDEFKIFKNHNIFDIYSGEGEYPVHIHSSVLNEQQKLIKSIKEQYSLE